MLEVYAIFTSSSDKASFFFFFGPAFSCLPVHPDDYLFSRRGRTREVPSWGLEPRKLGWKLVTKPCRNGKHVNHCKPTLWLFVGSNGWRLLLRQQRVVILPFQAGIWYSSSFLHLWAPRQVKALWHRDATSISWSLEGWWHSMKPHSYLQETVLLIIRICTSCGVHETVGFQWLEKNPKFSSVRQDTVFSSRSHLRELDFLMRKLPPWGICGWICGSRSSLQVFQHRSPSLSPACAVEWKGQLQLVVQRCFDSRGLMPMVQDLHCWWGLVSKWCKFLIRKSWRWSSCSKWCKLRLREV